MVLLCGFGSAQPTDECNQKFANFNLNEELKVVVDLKKVLEKEFLAAPGALEEKLDLYKIICDKLTKKSDEVSQKINDNLLECFDANTKANLLFQQDITLHYNHYVCNIDQEAYSAMISPANVHKVEIKMAELDNCFKLAYTKSGESHFCG